MPTKTKNQALAEQIATKLHTEKPDSRQAARHFLFCAAFAEVTQRNSHLGTREGKKYWFIDMSRKARRNLARAYAAGEWRRQSPATRGVFA